MKLKPNLQLKITHNSNDFASDLMTALRLRPRSISPKYFYDTKGSALFDQICNLPEYYPTRTELSILRRKAHEMAELMGPRAELVEFGAGSLHKVRMLLDAMQAPSRYIPIDISGDHLHASCSLLQDDYPSLDIHPLIADYTSPLILPAPISAKSKRIGFFPGSTIGNFTPREARAFLHMAASVLRGGALILGVDLIKAPHLLHAAYNDTQGITAQFNLNLLERANRELDAVFDIDKFSHYAFYNAPMQRIEMHLMSRCQQQVHIQNERYEFDEGETLHTENSYKFTLKGIRNMAQLAGFTPGPVWCDKEGLFSLHWLQAPS